MLSVSNSVKKLFTEEDPYNIHKTFGFLTLGNFVLQPYYYINYGEMFHIDKFIFIHIILHLTSFVFKVLKQRPESSDKMKMFIWEELRMHSMLFTYRACFCILYPEFSRWIVILTMCAADYTTYKIGNANFTTVRGQHNRSSNSLVKKTYGAFFSMSQMGATAICSGCFQPSFNTFLAFQTLIPIQTSAFGLTLLRKNLINKTIWQVIYTFELSLVYIMWYREYKNLNIIMMSAIPYICRRFGMSKYFIWFLFFTINDLINISEYYLKSI